MSKTRPLSTSANIYAELIPRAARGGADGIAWILDTAEREELGTPVCRAYRPVRRHPHPHAPTTLLRTGPCSPATTMRPPPDTAIERAGTWFPKYRLSQPTSQSGRQDLNLRPLDPQSSALPSCATSRGLGACSGAWGGSAVGFSTLSPVVPATWKTIQHVGGCSLPGSGVGGVRGWGGGRRR